MTPRQAKLGVDVFTGAMIVSVALALANLTWRLTGEPGVGPAAAPVVARGGGSVDITQLIALAPFGSAAAPGAVASNTGAVTLKAIFMAIPAEASVVLLATADGQVASYGLGAAVAGGVIEAIAAEQITIRTPSGGLQTIGFDPDAGAVAGAAGATATGAPGVAPVPSVPPVANPIFQTAPPRASGAEAVRALIPSASQGRPAAVGAASQVSAPPAAASGGGYPIGSTVPPVLAAAGIRTGDVVQRVNGTPIGAGVNFSDLAARAFASGSAQVEVVRNGQRIFLTIPAR